MKKFRFTIRSEYVTTVDIEAEDEHQAFEELDSYMEDGGTGSGGYWNTREVDEDPELICFSCNESQNRWWKIRCCNNPTFTM